MWSVHVSVVLHQQPDTFPLPVLHTYILHPHIHPPCILDYMHLRTHIHTYACTSLTVPPPPSSAPPCPIPSHVHIHIHVHVPPQYPCPHIHPWHICISTKTPSHSLTTHSIHSPTGPPTSPTSHPVVSLAPPCNPFYPLAMRLSCLLSRGLHLELTLRHLLAHA